MQIEAELANMGPNEMPDVSGYLPGTVQLADPKTGERNPNLPPRPIPVDYGNVDSFQYGQKILPWSDPRKYNWSSQVDHVNQQAFGNRK